SFNYVAMDDDTAINAALTIPAGKRLTVNGDLTGANNLTVNGELVVTGTINDASALNGTGSVTVAGIKDTVANTKAAPVITAVSVEGDDYSDQTKNVMTVTFNKVMDASTLNTTNVTEDSVAAAIDTISVEGKVVTITFKDGVLANGEKITFTAN